MGCALQYNLSSGLIESKVGQGVHGLYIIFESQAHSDCCFQAYQHLLKADLLFVVIHRGYILECFFCYIR